MEKGVVINMKKLLLILLTLSVFISSFSVLSLLSFAADGVQTKNTVSYASNGQNLLNAGGKAFALNLSVRQQADTFDLRLIVIEDLRKVDHTADLTVTFSFSAKGKNREKSYTLKAEGGDFKRYASVNAAGKIYTAAENHALFGIVINGIPYEDFSALQVTVKQGNQTLYTGKMPYGTLFASDSDFQASVVTDLSKKWMSFIDDNTKINQISIPGTHDSGARTEPLSGTAKTQSANITQQLEMGVRGFDIRCKVENGGFQLYHGITKQPDTFDQVLEAYENFLTVHPGETILMSMKQEDDNNANFNSIMASYIQKNPDLWYTKNAIPTLGEVRGKIVLLSRYGGSSAPGIRLDPGFADNTAFTVNNGVACRVQDYYEVGSSSNLDKKWSMIEEQLNYAHSASAKNTLCINFTSGYTSGLFGLPSITIVSNKINPQLKTFFASAEKGSYGLLLSDFADAALCSGIFMTNFNQ